MVRPQAQGLDELYTGILDELYTGILDELYTGILDELYTGILDVVWANCVHGIALLLLRTCAPWEAVCVFD